MEASTAAPKSTPRQPAAPEPENDTPASRKKDPHYDVFLVHDDGRWELVKENEAATSRRTAREQVLPGRTGIRVATVKHGEIKIEDVVDANAELVAKLTENLVAQGIDREQAEASARAAVATSE